MRLKLNKWQRVGVVLSVLAFVGLGIYAWVFEARQRDSFYSTQLSMCYNTLRTQDDALQGLGTQEDRIEREAANQAEYAQCMNEADAALRESFNAKSRAHANFSRKSAWNNRRRLVDRMVHSRDREMD